MQEHVKLEVSLEVINKEIANVIKQLNMAHDKYEIQKLKTKLDEFFDLQEQAYRGNRFAIEKILNFRKENSGNE